MGVSLPARYRRRAAVMPCNCPRGRRSVAECDECQYQIAIAEKKRLRLHSRTRRTQQPKKDNPRPPQRKASQSLLPCSNRGELAGKMNCSCQGAREVFRCTKLIRPTSTVEQAFCTQYAATKYVGIVLSDGTKISKDLVPLSEIVVCQPGRCDLYHPAIPLPKPLPAV